MADEPSDASTVSVERDNQVATVSVDRPESMNSLNISVLEKLADAVETAMTNDSVTVVVLRGSDDDAFVSGADIDDFASNDGLWWKSEFRRAFERVEDAIEGGTKPVIAAVDGLALGGGSELALMCDVVIASENATFGFPEITLGGIPGVGGTQRLAHLVGVLKAKELVLTGQRVDASEAVEIGMATRVVTEDAFADEVDTLATDLATNPPVAMWFAKTAINRTRGDLESGLELEAALGAMLFETDDFDEGTSAFVEKRDAEFGGWDDLR